MESYDFQTLHERFGCLYNFGDTVRIVKIPQRVDILTKWAQSIKQDIQNKPQFANTHKKNLKACEYELKAYRESLNKEGVIRKIDVTGEIHAYEVALGDHTLSITQDCLEAVK